MRILLVGPESQAKEARLDELLRQLFPKELPSYTHERMDSWSLCQVARRISGSCLHGQPFQIVVFLDKAGADQYVAIICQHLGKAFEPPRFFYYNSQHGFHEEIVL